MIQNHERERCLFSGKLSFTQKEAGEIINSAKNSTRKTKIIPQRSYYCKHCRTWHLTHYRQERTCKATLRRYGRRDYIVSLK